MAFIAHQAVSSLDFDFTAFVPGVKGTTPEPSSEQVRHMQFAIRELLGLEEGNATEVQEALNAMSEQELEDNDAEMTAIYADVCSGKPSAEQIMALPHRVRQAYIGYLTGELLNPTAGSSVTKRSLAPVKTG